MEAPETPIRAAAAETGAYTPRNRRRASDATIGAGTVESDLTEDAFIDTARRAEFLDVRCPPLLPVFLALDCHFAPRE
jgi:hypothetical protein